MIDHCSPDEDCLYICNCFYLQLVQPHLQYGNTVHVNGQKFYMRSGAFASPLPSRDPGDYVLETPEEEGHDHERKRQRIEKSNKC